MIPRAIIFDLDNTLAPSKQAISAEMATLLAQLLARTNAAIMSGGALAQLSTQAAARLASDATREHLYLLPTSGASLFTYANGAWEPVYQELLSAEEAAEIACALEEGARTTGLVDLAHPQYGPYIENRGAQVSLSALGQMAPLDAKQAWDPTREKRERLRAAIAPLLPGFDVKVGGLTTIDVTKRGINKAYGVRQLSAHLSIPVSEMLYVGDELGAGGNDEVVKQTGIPTRAVASPAETAQLIGQLLAQ